MKQKLLCLAILLSAVSQAQTPRPAFEVADIKPSTSKDSMESGKGLLPGGRFEVSNVTLKSMIQGAYSIHGDMIHGAPAWLDTDRFDIVAKAPADASRADIFLMLQTLLAERFQLTVHREEKEVPVYGLSAGKGEPKLQPSATPGRPGCAPMKIVAGLIQRDCHNMTMSDLVRQLPMWAPAVIDRPVVDQTELKGAYDFHMEWDPRTNSPNGGDGPTIFNAVEKLGLKLQSRKSPLPTLVIDHITRTPTAN